MLGYRTLVVNRENEEVVVRAEIVLFMCDAVKDGELGSMTDEKEEFDAVVDGTGNPIFIGGFTGTPRSVSVA